MVKGQTELDPLRKKLEEADNIATEGFQDFKIIVCRGWYQLYIVRHMAQAWNLFAEEHRRRMGINPTEYEYMEVEFDSMVNNFP